MKYQSNQTFLFNLIADMATAAIIKMKGIKGSLESGFPMNCQYQGY